MDKELKLSEKEQKLLDYINKREEEITVEWIKVELGESYLGALGKLMRYGLIEVTKKQIEHRLNKYGTHYVKVYIPKRTGELEPPCSKDQIRTLGIGD